MKIFFLLIVSFLVGFIIDPIDYLLQKELYDLLIQISSIVLAISGAWLAVIFPESFKNILNFSNEYKSDYEIIKVLVNVMIGSLIILIIVALIKFFALISSNIIFFLEYKNILKQISLSFLTGLYIYELYILLLVIFPIRNIFNRATKENMKNNMIDKKHRNI
jgi:hypothetical protein